jgi:hypothetical protein
MFIKSKAQKLPPRRRYDFRVDLVPGAQPQASRIIPLSPAENSALEEMIHTGLSNGKYVEPHRHGLPLYSSQGRRTVISVLVSITGSLIP